MRVHTPRRVTAVAVVALTLAGCSGGDDTASSTSVADTTATSSTAAGVTTASTGASSVPLTSDGAGAPATTAPSETTPTTVAATTTTLPESTTTTEPPAVTELVLSPEAIGSAYFGAETEVVIDYITSILGGTTDDSGWVAVGTIGSCGDTVNRRVHWGSLALVFADLSPYANGRRHFIGWEYGLEGELGSEPVGLRTAGGVTIGSRVVDLLAEFPDAAINPGQDDIGSPPNFYVSDQFRGLLTGAEPDDLVTVMFGGYGCAE